MCTAVSAIGMLLKGFKQKWWHTFRSEVNKGNCVKIALKQVQDRGTKPTNSFASAQHQDRTTDFDNRKRRRKSGKHIGK